KESSSELIAPKVSHDINGGKSDEVVKGEKYYQNIRVIMPDDVNNYESLAIENDLDKRVEIKNAKVLIRDKGDTDGEGEEVSSVKPNVNGQNVALKLTGAELQQFAGQDVNVQIVSQVGEDAQAGDAIVHEPTVEINEEM